MNKTVSLYFSITGLIYCSKSTDVINVFLILMVYYSHDVLHFCCNLFSWPRRTAPCSFVCLDVIFPASQIDIESWECYSFFTRLKWSFIASSDQLSDGLFNVTYTSDCQRDIESLFLEYLAIFVMIDVFCSSR